MVPIVLTQAGVGTSTPAVFDTFRNPFNIGIGCVVTGTATYTIQHTFDDIQTIGTAACTWFNHDDAALVAATTNADSNFAYPCRAARINLTVGTGTVVATFLQAGMRGG